MHLSSIKDALYKHIKNNTKNKIKSDNNCENEAINN